MAAKKETQESTRMPQVEKENVLVAWRASTRPFKRRNREFFINIGAVAVLFALILLIIDGLMPVLLIGALFFLFYVFSTIEPDQVEYKITSFGIRIGDTLRDWDELGRYWFAMRAGHEILVIETATAPWRLELVLDTPSKKKVEDVISKHLYLNESPDTMVDRTLGWVTDKLQM